MKSLPQSVTPGQQFTDWTVIGPSEKRYHATCRCKCGKEQDVRNSHLYSGHTRGCKKCCGKRVSASKITHGHNTRNSGPTPTYRIWIGMLERCRNPRTLQYADYGGRGIAVCEHWHKYENFLADMGERPAKLTLDRIDNDGNYEPGNCRWATYKEQGTHTRRSHYLTFNGRTKSISEWAEETGLPHRVIQSRIVKMKWTVEQTLTLPATGVRRTRR